MTRDEYLKWAKERALAYLPSNVPDAIASILSDLSKHEDFRKTVEGPIVTIGMIAVINDNPSEARRFIEEFN